MGFPRREALSPVRFKRAGFHKRRSWFHPCRSMSRHVLFLLPFLPSIAFLWSPSIPPIHSSMHSFQAIPSSTRIPHVQITWTLNIVLATVFRCSGGDVGPVLATFQSPRASQRIQGSSTVGDRHGLRFGTNKVLEREIWTSAIASGSGWSLQSCGRPWRFRVAVAGFEVWALVLGYVAGEDRSRTCRVGHASLPAQIRIRPSILKSMLGYSLYIFGVSMVERARRTTATTAPRRGAFSAPLRSGCYTIAYKVPEMLLESVCWVFSLRRVSGLLRLPEIGADSLRAAVRSFRCDDDHIAGILGGRHRSSGAKTS